LAARWRTWVILLVGSGLALVAFAVVFRLLVRARVMKEGAQRGLTITMGDVRPGFFAVNLRDLRVELPEIHGVDMHFANVRINLSAMLSPKEVLVEGGQIRIDGEPEELVDQLRRFRKVGDGRTSERAHRMPIHVSGVSLAWRMPSGGSLSGAGLRFARTDDAIAFGGAELSATYRRTTLRVEDADAEFSPDGDARIVKVSALAIEHGADRAAAPAPTPTGSILEPVPPPLPPPMRDTASSRSVDSAAAIEPEEPLLPLPDLHALRAKIAAAITTLGARVPDGTKLDVGGLSVKLDAGAEPFAFGPGPFSFERRGNVIHAAFTSDARGEHETRGTPLSFDVEIPLGDGDVVARLEGGPVSLALLGVKNGMKGLSDVERGMASGKGLVVLSASGDALTFDGQVALHSISIMQPRLSPDPVKGLDFAVLARGVLDDKGLLRIDDARLDMGALHVRARGTIEQPRDHFRVALAGDVAPASCQALLESAPAGLLPTVRAAKMSGTFGATAHVAFDTRTIDKLTLDYEIDDRCKAVEVPSDLARKRFNGPFTYRTYHPDGTPGETTTGPGTPPWTALEDISPFMVAAVLTTEDGAFYRHHGFNHAAIRGSVAANLKARRFVRGASTITMQLAKNLFLSRNKTLSRKIEEVILTDYLEQVFRKDDMMELYLNVVEFGPDIYGITSAANHYFGRKPGELTLPECFFLATLLPSPIRYSKLWDKGQVPESWMNHIKTLMQIAEKYDKITRAELDNGLEQPIVFHKPGDPPPEPRKPIPANDRDPYEEWHSLD